MKYKIRNWEMFQHYKDRNPPWIKLHYELLTSQDWVTLADASRVLAVAIMLVASRSNGEIDCSESGLEYLKRVAYLNSPPDVKPLINCGFLIPASDMLADASALHQNARPETYKEETETEADISPTGDCLPKAKDACPQQEIISEYHRILPELRPVKVWSKSRQDLLRARWREAKERQSVSWWSDYFKSVRECPFLLGKVDGRNGKPFSADLEWLIRPTNMPKVIEGKYKDQGQGEWV